MNKKFKQNNLMAFAEDEPLVVCILEDGKDHMDLEKDMKSVEADSD